MNKFGRFTLSLVLVSVLIFSGCATKKETEQVTIRFGTLPVLQALDVYVAAEKGYFDTEKVKVELINFNTAAEKDIALTAGQIDGYFGDLFTPIVVEGNGVDISIVATNYNTLANRHMFAVLSSPKSNVKSIDQLAGVPVAISSNSVIHYVTETLVENGGVTLDEFATMESKNIGLRMQMLMSGQIEAATLPEPLVSAAAKGGATILANDEGIAPSQTVLIFSEKFAKDHPKAVKKFLKAIDKAHNEINTNPDDVRSVMVEYIRLPEPMKATYPIPSFPNLSVPDKELVMEVVSWLTDKEALKKELTYEELVNGVYLP